MAEIDQHLATRIQHLATRIQHLATRIDIILLASRAFRWLHRYHPVRARRSSIAAATGEYRPLSSQNNHLRHITYAAWRLAEGSLWLAALADDRDPAVVPAMCDLMTSSADEVVRVRAIRNLARKFAAHPSVQYTLYTQLSSPSSPIRASVALHTPNEALPLNAWRHILTRDSAPLARRAAARALAGKNDWATIVRIGLSDPVWRVRRDAAESLVRSGLTDAELETLLATSGSSRHARRACAFIRARRADDVSLPDEPERPIYTTLPWWSEDPAVLLTILKHVPTATLGQALPRLISLVEWQDGYPLTDCMREIRSLIGRVVHARGSREDDLAIAGYLDLPRIPYVQAWAREWLAHAARTADLAEALLNRNTGRESLIWAIEQQAVSTDLERVRAMLPCTTSEFGDVRTAVLDAVRRHAPAIGRDREVYRAAMAAAEAGVTDDEPTVRTAAVGLLSVLVDWRRTRARLPAVMEPAVLLGCLRYLPDEWLRAEADGAVGVGLTDMASAPIEVRLALAKRAKTGQIWCIGERLVDDVDHRVRAQALTPARATALCAQPESESSWRVLARAADMCGISLDELAPRALRPWPRRRASDGHGFVSRPEPMPDVQVPPGWHTDSYFQNLQLQPLSAIPAVSWPGEAPACMRSLRSGRPLAPLIISGRHSLSETGFACALEGGVNGLFWEPEYRAQTRFIRSLSALERRQLVFLGGTFAHAPDEVVTDIDAMLRVLGIECIDVFFLFWVRDRARLADDVARALLDAQRAGKVTAFGLSTHDRALAKGALDIGWDTLMVRHSAAHPGIETDVLPTALASGAQVFTFSNLTYTLMLRERADTPLPYEAPDCYRYSLSQPGVTACISAPRTVREVRHNLSVLERPTLEPSFQQRMRAYAARVRHESHRMRRLIRAD